MSKTATAHTHDLLSGARASLPLWVGVTPYGLAFGLLGQTVGLSPAATLAMSVLVFAGSAQFIALGLLGAGASAPLIVATTLVVNLRHLLYGASLAPYLGRPSRAWQAALAFLLTDESYAVTIGRFRSAGVAAPRAYYLGAGLVIYLDWVLSTAAGLALGSLVPDPAALGLDFALPATFIGLLVPELLASRRASPESSGDPSAAGAAEAPGRRALWVTVGAAAAGVLLLSGLPGRLDILLAIVLAATAGWGVERWRTRS